MLIITEKILRNELRNKPQDLLSGSQEFYYMQLEKELSVLEKLDITLCDMRGEVDEVKERLDSSEILFCPKGEVARIKELEEINKELQRLYLNHNDFFMQGVIN